jgi:hypothetical protein
MGHGTPSARAIFAHIPCSTHSVCSTHICSHDIEQTSPGRARSTHTRGPVAWEHGQLENILCVLHD